MAEVLIENFIFSGYEKAVNREYLISRTGLNDREIRRMISEAVKYRNVPIVNVGSGYFIYDGSSRDKEALERYYARESRKARSIFDRLQTIKRVINFDENQEVLEV